jgi:hypothetical protein
MHHHHSFPGLENQVTHLIAAIDWGGAGWCGFDLNNQSRTQEKQAIKNPTEVGFL